MLAHIVELGSLLVVLLAVVAYIGARKFILPRAVRLQRKVASRRINLAKPRLIPKLPRPRRSILKTGLQSVVGICLVLAAIAIALWMAWIVFVVWVCVKAMALEDRYAKWRMRNVVAAGPEEPITYPRRWWLRKEGFYL